MRIVFYQPHTARIGHHIREYFTGSSIPAYQKYRFLIEALLRQQPKTCAIYIDIDTQKPWYSYFKVWTWLLINRISPFTIAILSNPSQLAPNQDVIFSFPFLSSTPITFTSESVLNQFKGVKLVHASHYFDNLHVLGPFFRNIQNIHFVSESDIQLNPLYRRYFSSFPLVILPFALKNRYQSKKPFDQRKNKCFAFGTKSKADSHRYKDFIELFKSDYLHKLRAEIFYAKNSLMPYLDSHIFDFDEESDFTNDENSFFPSWFKRRSRFFSIDIVEKYNSYRMFVSPEEESGAPSINFIEGMASGCAYIGRPEFYRGLPIVEGVHFIGYDGTLESLIDKISYYQTHSNELKAIALAGKEAVTKHFHPLEVTNKFLMQLKEKLNENS